MEVLQARVNGLAIFDGRTGAERFASTIEQGSEQWEYPTVADLDGDGHAELLVANSGGSHVALVVLEHDGTGWSGAGGTWPVYDYAVDNIGVDGGIPASIRADRLVSKRTETENQNIHLPFRRRPARDVCGRSRQEQCRDTCQHESCFPRERQLKLLENQVDAFPIAFCLFFHFEKLQFRK